MPIEDGWATRSLWGDIRVICAWLAYCLDAIKWSSHVVHNGWWWPMSNLWSGGAGRRDADPVGAAEGLALRWPSTVIDAALPEWA